MFVKICGITTEEAFDATVESGADLIGFVFFPGSPRHLRWQEAKKFGSRPAGTVKKVAVVANPTMDELEVIVELLKPDVIQLHGDEHPLRVYDIKERFNLPIIKTFPLYYKEDLNPVASYDKYAHYILFDSKSCYDADVLHSRPSKPFDWGWLKGCKDQYFLAGGLTAANVAEAIAATWPYCRGVDVSSGVEESIGVKSPDKIKQFVQRVREVTPQPKGKWHVEQEEACAW